jgi:arsenate reductase
MLDLRHNGASSTPFPFVRSSRLSPDVLRVLFVSRRDSLRSVLASACLAHIGLDRFAANSCGQPGHVAEAIHPAAIAALDTARIPVPRHSPQPWTTLWRTGLPRFDIVVTLDERALNHEPSWPDQPMSALWALDDVAAMDDAEAGARAAMQMLYVLQRRLELLANLPFHRADSTAIRSDLRDLGYMR